MKIQTKKSLKKNILIALLALLLAAPGYLALAKYNSLWPLNESPQDISDSSGQPNRPANSVDYSEPSDEYLKQSQSDKEKRLTEAEKKYKEENISNKNPDAKTKVELNISFADIYDSNLEIRAFITGVIEGTGVCTATVSKSGEQPITSSKPAFVDATSSICQPILIPKSKLNPGTWNIDVTYLSPGHESNTAKAKVEIK